MESASTEDMPKSSSNEDYKDVLEDIDEQSTVGMNAVKEHISKDKTTFVMYCSRIFQIVAALGYLLPIIL